MHEIIYIYYSLNINILILYVQCKNKNLCIFLDTAEEIMQEIGRSFKIYQHINYQAIVTLHDFSSQLKRFSLTLHSKLALFTLVKQMFRTSNSVLISTTFSDL